MTDPKPINIGYHEEIREFIESTNRHQLSADFIEELYYRDPKTQFVWSVEDFGEVLQDCADGMEF